MKTIKLYIMAAVALATGLFAACTDYQDEVDALDTRVTILENLVDSVNTDIQKLQTIVEAMKTGDVIEKVVPLSDGSGYEIHFLNYGTIVVKDGQDGKPGDPGTAPVINMVEKDGVYYWTIDGKILEDDNGQPLIAVGKNGEDGKPITPELRIVDGKWQIDYKDGNGFVWMTDPVTGEIMSAVGAKGTDALTPIIDFKPTASGTEWTITYTDGAGNIVNYTFPLLASVLKVTIKIKEDGELKDYNNKLKEITKQTPYVITAEVAPKNNFKMHPVLWYISKGSTDDLEIANLPTESDANQISIVGKTSGKTVTLRAVSLYPALETDGPVYAECTIYIK